MNEDLADVFETLADFSEDPIVRAGREPAHAAVVSSLRPTLRFLTPVQTTCNYATIFLRNVASLLSEGDANGNYQRFLVVSAPTDPLTFELGPNNEGGPSAAPANGPRTPQPPAREPVSEHGRAGPDAGVRGAATSATRSAQTLIGNQPGNQGTQDGWAAMRRGHGSPA